LNRLFLGLAAALLLLVGIAAAKDAHDRGYLSIQDQYRKDHPSSVPGVSFDSKVQQLFPAFADAKRGDTFRVERCISCHVPDIAQIGPQQAATNLVTDFLKYEPDAQAMVKQYGLTLHHPALITQQLYDTYGEDSFATSDGFHPYLGLDANGKPTPVQLPGFIPKFISPAQNGGRPYGIDQVGCIVCHNGSRLATDQNAAHENLIVNPEYSFTEGAALYYKNCAVCHGNLGEGKVGPPLSNQDRLGFFNEDYYYRCIEFGFTDFEHVGSVMPAWGSEASDFHYDATRDKLKVPVTRQLSEDQIHILVQFIRHWENYDTLP
jgi:Cytochrome C oxidase, cbb3-type, subunit III